MNFFRRSMISLVRRPGKTLLLFALVVILGTVISGAVAVSGAINSTEANLRRRMRPIVTIEFDLVGWLEYHDLRIEEPVPMMTFFTQQQVHEIGALDYVNFYSMNSLGFLRSSELIRYGNRASFHGTPERFEVIGVNQPEVVQINQGIIDLVAGRQFEEGDLVASEDAVAIVSVQFAEVNNLSIGSTFELYEIVHFPDECQVRIFEGPCYDSDFVRYAEENIYERVSLEFTVIGLYDIPIDESLPPADFHREYFARREHINNIYTPLWTHEDLVIRRRKAEIVAFEYVGAKIPDWLTPWDDSEDLLGGFVLFVLEDPTDLGAFREVAESILPDYWYILDLFSEFDALVASMETLQSVGSLVLYGSISLTIMILSLLVTLFLHDRRHEIGIYLSLGEGRGRIVTQILLETGIVTVIGITIATFIGNNVSRMVSQNILQNELLTQVEQSERPSGDHIHWTTFNHLRIPPVYMSPEELMAAFDVSLNVQGVVLFYAVGLGVVAISTIVPVTYIVVLKPKKVLL